MGGTPVFKWTAEAVQTLTRLYADGQPRMAIAAVLRTDARVVGRKIERLDLARNLPPEERKARKLATTRHMQAVGMALRAEAGEFVWNDERLADMRRLYVAELRSASEVAAILGCKPRDVTRKAHDSGFTKLRDGLARQRDRLRAQQLASQRAAEARARERDATPPPPTDAELIAAAVAAGKVRHLPPGQACGLTGLERDLWASPPLSGRIERPARGRARKRVA
jgi:hypothetical protein